MSNDQQERESLILSHDSADHISVLSITDLEADHLSALVTTGLTADSNHIIVQSTTTLLLDEQPPTNDDIQSTSTLLQDEDTKDEKSEDPFTPFHEETTILFAESANTTPVKNNITIGFNEEDKAFMALSQLDISNISPSNENLQIISTTNISKEAGNESRSCSILNLTQLSKDSQPSKREYINEERTLVECMGDELLKIIRSKDSKESIPLLSICCNITNRAKAEMMIGREIGKREWSKAKMHSVFPGPGEPLCKNFWVNHRQKVKDEQLIQFMEWLKAADLIQNLSFGHKIVQYHNGLHVAIESVKRTDTLKNISKKYYAQFLDTVNEAEDLDQEGQEGDEYESDKSDYEHEDDDDECNQKSGELYLYLFLFFEYDILWSNSLVFILL